MKTLLTFAITLVSLILVAQPGKKSVVIGTMTTKPNAILIVNPKNSDQGVLLPQLSTAQRMSMTPSSPEEDGLLVFDQTEQAYFYWTRSGWARMLRDGGERYLSIDPAHFRELDRGDEIRHNNMALFESDNSFVTTSRNGKGEQIIAPVNLPHGSAISEVTVYYMDNHPDNIRVYLFRKPFTGDSEELINWESSGASQSISSESFTTFNGKETIDLENYSYRFVVRFDLAEDEEVDSPAKARQRLYGIRIKYQQ